MKKFTFNVTQTIEVEIDETKVDEEYLSAFSEVMWSVDDISEIASHVARNKALYGEYSVEFVPDDWYTTKIIDECTEEE